MKNLIKWFSLLTVAAILLLTVSCGSGEKTESNEQSHETTDEITSETEKSNEESKEVSVEYEKSTEEKSEETDMKKVPIPENANVITNLNFSNRGKKMGDNDGPAYCVYSETGFNKSSMDILISGIRMNTIRESDKKFVNAYIFLGCDIYKNGGWVNCFDCGFCYSGTRGNWHLFYNIYEPQNKGDSTWYESRVKLDDEHDYRLILDTSEEDGKATAIIYDITDNKKADEVSFGVKNLTKDGKNTSYLMNFALDYPENTKLDTSGKASNDFIEITLYNTDEDLYMQNVVVENAVLWKNGEEIIWSKKETDHNALWPDKNMKKIDYACTKVIGDSGVYSHFRVDLDMNR